ncbi:MAG: hypothetical protein ABSG59_00420 [Verrucomicrobiota bacterium]|jgi:hypothetical protein
MLRLIRNPRILFLLFLAALATGCQHPLAPSVAGPQPTFANHALLDAQATARLQKAMQAPAPTVKVVACVADADASPGLNPAAAPLVASAQKKPDCLELQLGDCFVQALKSFSGRH